MSMLKLEGDQPRLLADRTDRNTSRDAGRLGASELERKTSDFELKRSDLRAHYENVAARALSSVKRDWRFIVSLVAVALALACAVIPLLPRQYSATALVYPNLFSGEQGKLTPMGTIDAGSLVTSEARLIVSDAILQSVVKRLELDGKPGTIESRSWLSAAADWIRAMFLPETRNHSQFDRQVALLRNRVEVVKDTRSYLISISFTARSPELAAAIVNAIALEYLRDKKVQRAQSAVTAAEGELLRQLAINGEKHPKVLQSADGVESARAELQAFMTADDNSQHALMMDESIKLAIPNRTPTSPKGFVILGLAFVVSLLAGIGLAVWRDRLGFDPQQVAANLVSSGRDHVAGMIDRGRTVAVRLSRRLGAALASVGRQGRAFLRLGGNSAGDRWRRLRAGFAGLTGRPVAIARVEHRRLGASARSGRRSHNRRH